MGVLAFTGATQVLCIARDSPSQIGGGDEETKTTKAKTKTKTEAKTNTTKADTKTMTAPPKWWG